MLGLGLGDVAVHRDVGEQLADPRSMRTVDLMPAERREALEKLVEAEGDGWLLPRFAPPPWPVILRGDVWQVTDESDVEWMLPRLRPTPFRHFTDPVRLESDRADAVERTYIRCCSRSPAPFDAAAAHCDRRLDGGASRSIHPTFRMSRIHTW